MLSEKICPQNQTGRKVALCRAIFREVAKIPEFIRITFKPESLKFSRILPEIVDSGKHVDKLISRLEREAKMRAREEASV